MTKKQSKPKAEIKSSEIPDYAPGLLNVLKSVLDTTITSSPRGIHYSYICSDDEKPTLCFVIPTIDFFDNQPPNKEDTAASSFHEFLKNTLVYKVNESTASDLGWKQKSVGMVEDIDIPMFRKQYRPVSGLSSEFNIVYILLSSPQSAPTAALTIFGSCMEELGFSPYSNTATMQQLIRAVKFTNKVIGSFVSNDSFLDCLNSNSFFKQPMSSDSSLKSNADVT